VKGRPVELQSRRLSLRRVREGDAAALCAYRGLPQVARYQSWTSFGPEDAAKLIAEQSQIAVNTPGTWVQLALCLREGGEMVGDCGIHFRGDDDRQVELGITMSPAHQGRGLASEGVACVLNYLFESLGKHRVWASVDAQNEKAARLLRRLGFRQEAHFAENVWFKGGWGSELVFALLRREWEAAKAGGEVSE
jgi:RimJ/RimL family protein N-acetyltransferase